MMGSERNSMGDIAPIPQTEKIKKLTKWQEAQEVYKNKPTY